MKHFQVFQLRVVEFNCVSVFLLNYFVDLLVSQPVQEQPKAKKKKKRRKPDSYETFNGKVIFMLIYFGFL